MNQQKGFSLTEVLVCLLLVTTLVLALLQQQWRSRQLLNQLILRVENFQFFDQNEGSFLYSPHHSVHNKQSGLSLSEMLISLLLASIIMTTLMQFYLGSKAQYLEAEEVLDRGFDVQWVSDLLSDSIRRAGFTPCLGLDELKVVDRRSNKGIVRAVKIENQPQQFIQINRMSEHFSPVIKIQGARKILIPHSTAFHEKRPVLIADCDQAEVQELSSVTHSANESLITLTRSLLFSYDSPAYIGEFLEEQWFIKKNMQGENTLHYQLVHTEELTPLIHSLHSSKQLVQEKQLLEVSMGLEHDKIRKIKVMVRGS